MAAKPDVTTLVLELRAMLDHIGDALVNGSFDELIATESRLAGIVGGFSHVIGESGLPATAPSEVDEALAALRRCQRLGASFTDMRTSWAGASGSYDRAGRSQGPAGAPQTIINARV